MRLLLGFLSKLIGGVIQGLQPEVPGKVETRFGRLVIVRICRVCPKERAVAKFLGVDGAKRGKATIFIDETPCV